MDRRSFIVAGAGLTAASFLPGLASAQSTIPPYYPADYAGLIDASRREQGLTVYTSFSDAFWNPIRKLFAAKYPWITLQTLDLNGPEIIERFRLESAANARSADMLVFNGNAEFYEMSHAGELATYATPEIKFLPEWSYSLKATNAITVDAEIFVWNKLILSDAPRSLEALVARVKSDPKAFKGKIVTIPIFLDTYRFLIHQALYKKHGEKLWEWLEVLGPASRLERSGGTIFEKVQTGEYTMAYLMNQNSPLLASRQPERAAIFDWSFIADGTPMASRLGAIPAKARSPSSARLLLDTLVSKEGQIAVARGGRFPYRTDITPGDVGQGAYSYQMVSDQVKEENLLRLEYSPEIMKGYDAIVARWKKAYGV